MFLDYTEIKANDNLKSKCTGNKYTICQKEFL